jgi:transcriptional regulator with XRE-family HTH domain
MGKHIALKIRKLRTVLGINQSELADRLGVTQATVSRWEKGSLPDTSKLIQLSEMAGESVAGFIDEGVESVPNSTLLNRFEVRGVVAAGVWAAAYELPEEERAFYSGGTHVDAPEGARFGLVAKGASMNLVYPSGTILDCVQIEAFGQLKSGSRVIVERRRYDGDVEATVKEYVIGEDGREWLVPRSSDPAFQTAISANDPGPEISEIKVIAVVVGSYRPE